ncbi:hypothetical protein SALBM217S_09090 [Streptomyces griseoloalbus]
MTALRRWCSWASRSPTAWSSSAGAGVRRRRRRGGGAGRIGGRGRLRPGRGCGGSGAPGFGEEVSGRLLRPLTKIYDSMPPAVDGVEGGMSTPSTRRPVEPPAKGTDGGAASGAVHRTRRPLCARDSPAARGIMSLACSRGGAWDLLTQDSKHGMDHAGQSRLPPARPCGARRGARPWPQLLLLADAGIHAYEVIDADAHFLIGGFIATAVGTTVGALFFWPTRGPRLGWVVGGLTALLTTIGYIVTRATPVPTDEDDYGNWLEPLGVCSLVIQGIVVVMAAVASERARPATAGPPRPGGEVGDPRPPARRPGFRCAQRAAPVTMNHSPSRAAGTRPGHQAGPAGRPQVHSDEDPGPTSGLALTGTFCGNFTPRTATRHVTGPPACSKAPPAARQHSGNPVSPAVSTPTRRVCG